MLSAEELMLLNCGVLVLENSFESPLDCKDIQPVRSKGDQSWDFFRRSDQISRSVVSDSL